MDAKTQQLIEKVKGDPALARQLLSGVEGRKLMQLLTGSDGGAALQSAARSAAAGDTKNLAAMLARVMESSEGAALMQRISEKAKK